MLAISISGGKWLWEYDKAVTLYNMDLSIGMSNLSYFFPQLFIALVLLSSKSSRSLWFSGLFPRSQQHWLELQPPLPPTMCQGWLFCWLYFTWKSEAEGLKLSELPLMGGHYYEITKEASMGLGSGSCVSWLLGRLLAPSVPASPRKW